MANPEVKDSHPDEENTQQAPPKVEEKSFFTRFVNNVLIEKYDVTTSLLGRFSWPLITLFLVMLMHTEISNLILQVASNFSRTTKVTLGEVEVEYQAAFAPPDLQSIETYQAIQTLSREDLLLLIDMADIPINIRSSSFTPDYSARFSGLEEAGLIIIENPSSSSTTEEPKVKIVPTDLGSKVYAEVQILAVDFLKSLPANIDEN